MATDSTMRDDVETWLDNLEVEPGAARDGRHMRRIATTAQALDNAVADLDNAVAEARAAGDTWAMIGTALGVSRQAAYQRFGKPSSTRDVPVINGDHELSDNIDDERRVPISEARANLSALIKRTADGDITLMNHGRPAAVLVAPEHYRALLDELDELQDRLAVHDNSNSPGVPFGHVIAELGLTD